MRPFPGSGFDRLRSPAEQEAESVAYTSHRHSAPTQPRTRSATSARGVLSPTRIAVQGFAFSRRPQTMLAGLDLSTDDAA
jgi:hypothetical protein